MRLLVFIDLLENVLAISHAWHRRYSFLYVRCLSFTVKCRHHGHEIVFAYASRILGVLLAIVY